MVHAWAYIGSRYKIIHLFVFTWNGLLPVKTCQKETWQVIVELRVSSIVLKKRAIF